MAAVTIRVPTILRPHVGGRATVDGEGSTLREVLDGLDLRYPGLQGAIVDGHGGLHRFVNVYVNGEDVRYMAALETPVNEGDTISILPAIAGGTG